MIIKNKFFFITTFAIFFLLGGINKAQSALVIQPAFIKMDLTGKRNSGTFVLRNTSDNEERYRAKSVHFTITPAGSLKEIPFDEYSLAGWIKFNPQEFVLPPKSSRTVRFSVIPPVKIEQKEYWGAIEFMPLEGTKFSSATKNGRSINLKIMTVILVPIYGFVKGTAYSGEIKEISTKKEKENIYINCLLKNTGDGVLRLDGTCKIADLSGTILDEINFRKIVVFPKTERIVKLKVKNPLTVNNRYQARINLTSTDSRFKGKLSKEVEFNL